MKNKQQVEKELRNILEDYGNHYLLATQGQTLKQKSFIAQVINIIEKENKQTELQCLIDSRDFIKESPQEDLIAVFNEQIEDMKHEIH